MIGEIFAGLVLLTSLSISIGQHASPHSGSFVTVLTLLAAIAVVIIPVIVYGPSPTD